MPEQPWWWEPRRKGERTFDYLCRVLSRLGAHRLDRYAASARGQADMKQLLEDSDA